VIQKLPPFKTLSDEKIELDMVILFLTENEIEQANQLLYIQLGNIRKVLLHELKFFCFLSDEYL